MTWWSACGWTLLRTVLLTLAAWPASAVLARWLQESDGPQRGLRLTLLLVPFLFPELLTGYAYAPWVAGLPWPAEGLCCLLLWLRVIPVGAVALLAAPPAGVSASGWRLRQLLPPGRIRPLQQMTWCWERRGRRALPALALMGFVLFQEFELAALLKTVTWADWLFVAQVGGLPLSTSWRLASVPLICQLVVLLPVLGSLSISASVGRSLQPVLRRSAGWLCTAYVWLALGLMCVVPCGLLLRSSWHAVSRHLIERLQWAGLGKELVGGMAIAICAGTLAWWLAGQLRWRSRWSSAWLWLIPGCCGSLIVGLTLINVFQRGPLGMLYDTPLPWLLGLTIVLVPRAAVLQVWLRRISPGTAVHAARLATLLPGRTGAVATLWWRMDQQPTWLGLALVCWWGYLDVTVAYLLSPTGMVPGVVRLYNFMHYGRSAALAAEAAVLLVIPVLIAGAGLLLVRRLSGWPASASGQQNAVLGGQWREHAE